MTNFDAAKYNALHLGNVTTRRLGKVKREPALVSF